MLMMLIYWEEALIVNSKETGPEVNVDKTKYIAMSRDHNAVTI
jgi:hypothetical protein